MIEAEYDRSLITATREKLGWSRSELARRANMHASTVGQIESGKFIAYPSQIKKIEAALKRGLSD